MKIRNASNQRGLDFERRIEKTARRILRIEVRRDRQSGAGLHKADVRDRYGQMPIFIECKDHATLKLKEWWRDASNKAVVGQAPVVVFPLEHQDLCVLKFEDLLQLIREGMDWRESVDQLKAPVARVEGEMTPDNKMYQSLCKNGHIIAAGQARCQWKGCQYGSVPKKETKNANSRNTR